MSVGATQVVPCPRCGQRLRVPSDRGRILAKCGKCSHEFFWVGGSAPRASCVDCGIGVEAGRYLCDRCEARNRQTAPSESPIPEPSTVGAPPAPPTSPSPDNDRFFGLLGKCPQCGSTHIEQIEEHSEKQGCANAMGVVGIGALLLSCLMPCLSLAVAFWGLLGWGAVSLAPHLVSKEKIGTSRQCVSCGYRWRV